MHAHLDNIALKKWKLVYSGTKHVSKTVKVTNHTYIPDIICLNVFAVLQGCKQLRSLSSAKFKRVIQYYYFYNSHIG